MAMGRSLTAPAWALLALFIGYASAGTWIGNGPHGWARFDRAWPDVAQNVLVYIPFGILGVLTLRDLRLAWLRPVGAVAVGAGLFSVILEGLQLHTLERTASLTDVAAAVVGSIAGGVMAARVAAVLHRARDVIRPSGVLDATDTPIVIALLVALVVVAWWPFDPTLDPSTWADRWHIIRRDPWQAHGTAMLAQALLYTWLSLAIAASADRLPTREAVMASAAAAMATAVVIDGGQLAMGSQPIGVAGVVAQIAGATAGALLFASCRVPK